MQIAKRKSFLAFCTHFVFARTHTERERERVGEGERNGSDNILAMDKVAACHCECLEIRVLTEN